MMLAASLTAPKRRRLTWLLLFALFCVNTALAWHQAAHAFEQIAIDASSHPAQTAAQLDNHCDLCLSAHGFSSGPASLVQRLPLVETHWHWLTPSLPAILTRQVQPPQARAPPLPLPL